MYLVLELQKNGDAISNLAFDFADIRQAESKYFAVLSAAAISTVEKHSAVLLDDNGTCLRSECFEHPVEEASNEG